MSSPPLSPVRATPQFEMETSGGGVGNGDGGAGKGEAGVGSSCLAVGVRYEEAAIENGADGASAWGRGQAPMGGAFALGAAGV